MRVLWLEQNIQNIQNAKLQVNTVHKIPYIFIRFNPVYEGNLVKVFGHKCLQKKIEEKTSAEEKIKRENKIK